MRNTDEIGETVVLVLRRKSDEEGTNKELRLPEPFIIGLSVQTAIGEKDPRKVTASREGRGSRYLLRTNSRSIVDKLIKLTELSDGTQIEIFRHPTLNTIQGIVYEPDSISTDEKTIVENLASQGVHTVRRIKKRLNGKLENTPLLVLSFHGTVLPDHIYFGLLRLPVRVYYPSPMICFNCGTYGHSRKYCQQAGICLRCSQPSHLADGEQCKNLPFCMHCKNGHHISSRDCPKYKEEDKIVHIKVDQCISYIEARRRYNEENRRETIARKIQDQLKQEVATKDQLIVTLQKQVATLTKELSSLKASLKHRSQSQSSVVTRPVNDNLSLQSSQSIISSKNANTHESRKNTAFISPPSRRKDNRTQESINNIRTRSRSGKRQFEVSPTNSNATRGKRSTTQHVNTHSACSSDE
ncbi:uncharacterized protein LOC134209486 [Armigeres subalbatus]|uniref:uncharacterized protein LOC134209486 n=1 Tax=Armigeres subalbatus TaxID=124917 RepID=UPI002ED654FE